MKTTAFLLASVLTIHFTTSPALLAADGVPAGAADGRPPVATLPIPGADPAGTPGSRSRVDPGEVAADALVVRPLGLAATAVGAAIFVVALPFAAIAKDVKGTGATLVGAPARVTFQRRLGDFEVNR
jgi:hypothetical protein